MGAKRKKNNYFSRLLLKKINKREKITFRFFGRKCFEKIISTKFYTAPGDFEKMKERL